MARCVILWHHEIPESAGLGGDHYDWMFEHPARAEGRLITFRVGMPLDLAAPQSFTAIRGEDHRREYLDFEGEISGGRGRVTRVASGECLSVTETPTEVEVVVWFDGTGNVEHRFYGRLEGGTWAFVMELSPYQA